MSASKHVAAEARALPDVPSLLAAAVASIGGAGARCFAELAREEASRADIVVTNHARAARALPRRVL